MGDGGCRIRSPPWIRRVASQVLQLKVVFAVIQVGGYVKRADKLRLNDADRGIAAESSNSSSIEPQSASWRLWFGDSQPQMNPRRARQVCASARSFLAGEPVSVTQTFPWENCQSEYEKIVQDSHGNVWGIWWSNTPHRVTSSAISHQQASQMSRLVTRWEALLYEMPQTFPCDLCAIFSTPTERGSHGNGWVTETAGEQLPGRGGKKPPMIGHQAVMRIRFSSELDDSRVVAAWRTQCKYWERWEIKNQCQRNLSKTPRSGPTHG
ncbi:hypothetical protein B0H13DRAFT_1851933 [Mycena leptocephala]|nr:hypothetical protein B0H13DRAFT_1851933 [Mycena leptocephala]